MDHVREDSSCPPGWGADPPDLVRCRGEGWKVGSEQALLSTTWVPGAHIGRVAWHQWLPLSLQKSCLQR